MKNYLLADVDVSKRTRETSIDGIKSERLGVKLDFISNGDISSIKISDIVKKLKKMLAEFDPLDKSEKQFTEKDLIDFGNSLLSEQREQSIKNKENIRKVHQEDIDNFEHYTPTEKDVVKYAEQQVRELWFKSKNSIATEYKKEECKHTSIEEIQGGQIERCRHCGKTWGGN